MSSNLFNLFEDILVCDPQELYPWCVELKNEIQSKQVILLEGPLGGGKTTFTRHLVDVLGGKDVSSPSFAICQEYQAPSVLIQHVDLYRIQEESDLLSSGFWELFDLPAGLIIVEWANRLDYSTLPNHWSAWLIKISVEANKFRRFQWFKRDL